jgi:hypothetical protein
MKIFRRPYKKHETIKETVPFQYGPYKTPAENDTFHYGPYYSLIAKRQRIVWDYRDKKGILHSGVVDFPYEAHEKAKKFGYQPNEPT